MTLQTQTPLLSKVQHLPYMEPLVNELANKRIQELSKIEDFYLPKEI
jgi:hypothetical protein